MPQAQLLVILATFFICSGHNGLLTGMHDQVLEALSKVLLEQRNSEMWPQMLMEHGRYFCWLDTVWPCAFVSLHRAISPCRGGFFRFVKVRQRSTLVQI